MPFACNVIRTKLYRPPIADDLLLPYALIDELEPNRHKPITLFAATTSNNTDLTTKCRILSLRSVCSFVVLSALTIVNFKIPCGILKNNWYNKRIIVSQSFEQIIAPGWWILLDNEHSNLSVYLESILTALSKVFTEILSNQTIKYRTHRFAIINNTRSYSTK